MQPQKVLKDGKVVAVLISPGFGSGWSTWNAPEYREMLLFDERFVQAALQGATVEEARQLVEKVFGLKPDDYFCISGWETIKVRWVDVGMSFTVDSRDGYEVLEFLDNCYRA